jgi:peptidoglycan/xylan/chitin deacetylase (PgdA/CDA1 family)
VKQKGKLVISIDLELAWGVWDKLTAVQLAAAETEDRPICAALLALFERHQVPATWAMVGALLDPASAEEKPGRIASWYAPDIVEWVATTKVRHEIGSHGGRHTYFNAIDRDMARADLDLAREIHRAHGLPFKSLVFPRNAVDHLDVVAEVGLATYRGPDLQWFPTVGGAARILTRAANLADKMLPIAPSTAPPRSHDRLIELPGSMLLLGRNGLRRFALPTVTRRKLALGLTRAAESGQIFHFWFHPSNFYDRRQEQLDTVDWFLERAADAAGRGEIEIATMGAFAPSPAPAQCPVAPAAGVAH